MEELPARRRLREKQEREAAAAAGAGGGSTEGGGGDDYAPHGDRRSPDADTMVSDGTTAAERNQEAWKTFGTGTEAGRLLKQLYGDKSRPKIAYPKVRTKPRGQVPAFVPAGGKHDVDAREAKRVEKHVNVPRPTGGMEVRGVAWQVVLLQAISPAAVTCAHDGSCVQPRHLTQIEYAEMMGGRRKRGTAIAAEVSHRQAELDSYRPMPTKAKSTPLEKQRLQNINMFKGGKVLPDELTLAPIKGTLL